MLTLNLLPPQQKENLNYEIKRRIVQFLGFWLSAVIIVFGILMLPTFFFISYQQDGVMRILAIEEEALRATRASELEEKIRGVNVLLDEVLAREEKKVEVAPFIGKILASAPAGLSVTLLSYDPDKNSATIVGKADSRGALLKFIDLLKKSPEIKNVSSPVSNIIQQENINFSLGLETYGPERQQRP